MRDDATSDAVRRFAAIAEEYCALIERHTEFSKGDFILRAASACARLYAAALELPEKWTSIDISVDESAYAIRYRELRDSISGLLGESDLYWEYFDPHDEKSALSTILSNDLAEEWEDVGKGLDAYRRGKRLSVR